MDNKAGKGMGGAAVEPLIAEVARLFDFH